MIRTVYFQCDMPRSLADALNRESGCIYSRVLVEHYRIYRKHGVWLKAGQAEKLDDAYHGAEKRLLHAHSADAAAQGFYRACQTARTNKQQGGAGARYPHKRKGYRTTIWKHSALRFKKAASQGRQGGAEAVSAATTVLQLGLARGRPAIEVQLPASLAGLPLCALVEVRLVYNKAAHRYEWHMVVDDGLAAPAQPTAPGVMAGDMGEVHPIVLSTEQQAEVIACRELRAVRQQTNRVLASYQRAQARCQKRSRQWSRLQRHKRRFLAKQKLRVRDLEHKISRAVVQVAQEQHIGVIVLGDVRTINQGKRLQAISQQKISQWSHGQLRRFITNKATAAGIRVDTVNEAYTSRTCPNHACQHQHKPQGRIFRCPACGLLAHRDVVGAVNILSRFQHGQLATIPPPPIVKYRYPHLVAGKRSPLGTGHVAGKASSHRTEETAQAAPSAQPESQTPDCAAS